MDEAIQTDPRIENNFRYHSPRDGQIEKYKQLRSQGKQLAYVFHAYCPSSREKSIAMTKLEEAVMWANAAIARNETEACCTRGISFKGGD